MDELARCRRDDDELLILLVDLDDFSRINATMGHGVGDLVLTAHGSSGRQTEQTKNRPVDAVIMAVIDHLQVENQVTYQKE